MNFNTMLWTLPFVCFIAGYVSLSQLYRHQRITTPALIGTTIQHACTIASNNCLNMRIIEQREDTELPEGTIISQNPQAYTAVKPNQTLFCAMSKQPNITAPDLINKSKEQALEELKQAGIHGQCYMLESKHRKGYCFAQSPLPHATLTNKTVTFYVSSGIQRAILFPNLTYKPIKDILEFLKPYGMHVSITHSKTAEPHTCGSSCIISDQRPAPGALVTLDTKKPLHVQLQVYYQKSNS